MGGFLEVFRLREIDVFNEFLWIAVDEWKPSALHLNHDAIPLFESMENIE